MSLHIADNKKVGLVLLCLLLLSLLHTPGHCTSVTVAACESYTWNGTTYTSSGTYINGLDTLLLTIYHPVYSSVTEVACDSYLWNGSNIVTSVDYIYAHPDEHGCPLIDTLHIIVQHSSSGDTAVTACDGFSWDGQWLETSGQYHKTFTNSVGCDSIATLTLTLLASPRRDTAVTVCDSFFWRGQWRVASGQYHDTLTNSVGCDSIATLTLTLHPSSFHADTVNTCDSFFWNDQWRVASGLYQETLTNTVGCDSIATLTLTLRHSSLHTDTVTTCDSLFWSGQWLAASGQYHDTIINTVGCDSVATLSLTLHPFTIGDTAATACDSLFWRDQWLVTSGQYHDTLTNSAGCDSVATLTLTLHHSTTGTDTVAACDSLFWSGQWLEASGQYHDTLTNSVGCDSVATLTLTLHHSYLSTSHDTLCDGQPYSWRLHTLHSDNHFLTEDFLFADTLRTVQDCDSVLTIVVTKMARPQVRIDTALLCSLRGYTLTATVTAPLAPGAAPQPLPYLHWSSQPLDTLLLAQDTLATVRVSPRTVTDYLLFADYRPDPFCPFDTSITLTPVAVPEAELKVYPETLGYGRLNFKAYDISRQQEAHRAWYLDWQRQDETGAVLSGTASASADSVVVALELTGAQCRDTAVAVIPVCRVALFPPNVFTPLADDNNRFTIPSIGVLDGELYIYNRDGLLVAHLTTLSWDGRDSHGTLCPQGAYVWRLLYHAVDQPRQLHTLVGTVTLLR